MIDYLQLVSVRQVVCTASRLSSLFHALIMTMSESIRRESFLASGTDVLATGRYRGPRLYKSAKQNFTFIYHFYRSDYICKILGHLDIYL